MTNMANNKINILMVGSTLDVKGGMTTVVQSFINFNFDKVKLNYIPTHIDKNKIYQLIFYSFALIRIIFFLSFKGIDIVHIHLSERGSFIRKKIVFKLAKLFNKKIIIHMHGAEFKEYYNESSVKEQKQILDVLLGADSVIVLGESWNKYVKSLDNRINTIIMPNFIRVTEKSAEFDFNKEINILFLAVVTKRKGIFDLIDAIDLLKKDNKYDDYEIKVTIAGTGNEEFEAKKSVKQLNLEKYFNFVGWINQKDKNELLAKSQMLVLPSYNEGLPMSILEAMSYGLPVISTSVGSIEDAIIHNHNGLIIEPGDVIALKECIGYLIDNKDICSTFARNSKDLVNNVYDEKIYFDKIQRLYISLMCDCYEE